jgi:hypothetical protein
MALDPENFRAARFGIPRLPLPAIFCFALFAVGGSVFLGYRGFSYDEAKHSVASSSDAHVYSARAVPFDSRREDPAQRAASIARALMASQTRTHGGGTGNPAETASASEPMLLVAGDRELRGFTGLSNFTGTNSFLALMGMSFGISAQSAPSGLVAADAEMYTASAVPEASTWLCGGALIVLVAVRGAHASWHRKRRRDE